VAPFLVTWRGHPESCAIPDMQVKTSATELTIGFIQSSWRRPHR